AIIPGMTERKSGHIINIGSSAGKEVYPKGNVYCGSKHAVLAITEGMRIDLNPYGIKVGSINPGLVET
ncbi:SDR family oxidoreductase, partial [Seonamhaeicola marinus]